LFRVLELLIWCEIGRIGSNIEVVRPVDEGDAEWEGSIVVEADV